MLLEQSDKRLEGMSRQLQALQAAIAEAPVADKAAKDRHMEADVAAKEAQLELLHRLLEDKHGTLSGSGTGPSCCSPRVKLKAGAAAFLVQHA